MAFVSKLLGLMLSSSIQISVGSDLSLRQLDASMADEFFSLVDHNRAHLRLWLEWVDRIKSVSDSREFIENSRARAARGSLTFAIISRGEIAGIVSHHAVDANSRSVSIGYWLGEAHQGRGLARRSVEALTAFTLAVMGLREVRIRVAVDNVRSRKIPLDLNFELLDAKTDVETINGTEQRFLTYSLPRARWEAHACEKPLAGRAK